MDAGAAMGANDIQAKKRAYEDYRRRLEAQEAQERQGWTADQWGKAAAGAGGYALGVAAGVPRGAFDTVGDLGSGLDFATRLVDPFDPLASAPGQSAWEQVGRAAASGMGYLRDRASQPRLLLDDLQGGAQQLGRDVNPAPGFAPTATDQFRQGFHQGATAGEAAFDTATMFGVGPELKTLRELGYIGEAPTVAERVAKGATERQALYLAAPYDPRGMGSHGFIPQRARLPGGRPIPQSFLDSKWNRTMPAPWATKGQMFEYHYGIDPSYQGGRVSKDFGGGGWSGKALNWNKAGRAEQIWRGIPLRTKAAGYAGLGAVGAMYNPFLDPGDD